MTDLLDLTDVALVVIDVQRGFDDPRFGRRNNPAAEANIGRLVAAWSDAGRPIVRVRHASVEPGSPLRPDAPGYAFKPVAADLVPALDVVKSVHSAFLGTPDLRGWLGATGLDGVVVCGVQTNRCCETTARWAGDLGYRVFFAADATFTFDEGGATADEIAAGTVRNLDGHFARVVSTAELVGVAV